jgi:hypothetical protein
LGEHLSFAVLDGLAGGEQGEVGVVVELLELSEGGRLVGLSRSSDS